MYWACLYRNFNFDDVIWSDETMIVINDCKNKIWVKKGQEKIVRKVKFPLKIMIWGFIYKNSRLFVHICEKTMKGEYYVETLKQMLIPFIKDKNNITFQQYCATSHSCDFTI